MNPSHQLYHSATSCLLGRITLTGTIHNSIGLPPKPMRVLGSYAVVYLLAGGGHYADANGCRQRVGAGDLLVLFPDLAHTYGPEPGGRWDEIYLVFEGPVFDLWRQSGLLTPAQPVHHLEPVRWWQQRLAGVVAPNLSTPERLALLQAVLAGALAAGAQPEEAWLRPARALLEADMDRELYVEDVARQLKLSPETFRKKFSRLAGLSPWHYRLTRIIDRACQLVHEGRLTNKEIAAQLGFSDEFHFSRRFKQITGRSPSQFRALIPRSTG
jgi:AraC-like DNA-binding protein